MSSHKFASSFGCLDAWMLRFRSRDLRFPVFGCFVFDLGVLRFRNYPFSACNKRKWKTSARRQISHLFDWVLFYLDSFDWDWHDGVWSGRRTDRCSILLDYIPHLRTTLTSYHGNIRISVGKVWTPVSTPIWRRSMISFSKYKRTFLVAEYSFNLTAKESFYIHPRQQRW